MLPVYLLIGVYVVAQALPQNADDELYQRLRPWAALALVTNSVWLYLFAFQLFWLALVDIALYLYSLWRLVALVDLDLLAKAEESTPWWKAFGAHLAFAMNGAWVTVATLLQLQINLMEEGYYPSADLTVGLIGVLSLIASTRAYARADWVWAATSAWALSAVGASQSADSEWGCLSKVCDACAQGSQRICEREVPAPLGWAHACSDKPEVIAASCVLDKSYAVAAATATAITVVGLALVAGIARGLLARRAAAKAAASSDSPFRRID
mmetsp:Transcript_15995/g.48885  ORF Transcript_15995/g.48885 Transcript_15995/m.48885 type:complete len:268 (-) Transcript_15995:475-1278(-)